MAIPACYLPEEAQEIVGEDQVAWGARRIIKSRLEEIQPVCELIQSYCELRSNADSAVPMLGADMNLVLTELLTNIVLHAYEKRPDRNIEARARFTGEFLELLIIDQGTELPSSVLEGAEIDFDGEDIFELPEGGFGWGIVHAIIDKIEYQRVNDTNRLLLRKNIFFNREGR